MSELREALLSLRDLLRSRGVSWGEGTPRATVAARTAAAGIPQIDDLITWYELCPHGTYLCPNGRVLALESVLEDHAEMVFIAEADFPAEAAPVADWFYLTSMEHGGYSLYLRGSEGERPVVWRTSVREFHDPWVWRAGLSALVNVWHDAFVRGFYVIDDGVPDYADPDDLSDLRRVNRQI